MTTTSLRPRRITSRVLLAGITAVLLSSLTAPAALAAPAAPISATAVSSARPVALSTASSATPTSLVAAANPAGGDPSGAKYSTGRAVTTVGQIMGLTNSCTATVVGSTSGRVLVTAAHCVYIPAKAPAFTGGFHGQAPGWIKQLTFVPGRAGDQAPYGVWGVDRSWVDQRWIDSGDPRFDVAFVRLAPLQGRTAQQSLGSQGITFDAVTGHPAATVLGYPGEAPFDGTSMRRCTTPAVGTPGPTYFDDLSIGCRMNPGASGGPWMTGFDAKRGTGTVVAVTSAMAPDHSNQLYGVRLGAAAQRLYESADRGR